MPLVCLNPPASVSLPACDSMLYWLPPLVPTIWAVTVLAPLRLDRAGMSAVPACRPSRVKTSPMEMLLVSVTTPEPLTFPLIVVPPAALPRAVLLASRNSPPETVVVPVYVLPPAPSTGLSTHVPVPLLVRLVALDPWLVSEMLKVLSPVLVPVSVSVRVPGVSNRLMFAPLCVKLSVAEGELPEASMVAPLPLSMRISRLVLCGVEPVYWSVPPRKCRPMPVTVLFSSEVPRAPIALAAP
ncbi:MAG: hypothetical protein BWX88_05202 [Planctomycetes bacterium ADurb.Bin126]|nr:MAG: hypothetical protein BWX88_05202 [Planctomycetes bacterium ADurb.Bin126]